MFSPAPSTGSPASASRGGVAGARSACRSRTGGKMQRAGDQGRDLDRRAAMRGMNELVVADIDADMGEGAAVAEEDEVSALEVAARDRLALARHIVRHAREI